MKGQGQWAQLIAQRFRLACQRFGLNLDRTLLDHGAFQGAVAMAEETRAVQGALF